MTTREAWLLTAIAVGVLLADLLLIMLITQVDRLRLMLRQIHRLQVIARDESRIAVYRQPVAEPETDDPDP